LSIQRVFCLSCHLVRQVNANFADKRRSYTRSFERYALELSRHMTIQDVAMDMSPAYISAVSKNLKEVAIVFDHFHIIKLFSEKLSDFRCKLYRDAATAQQKNVLKGTRWLLLKNPDNLDETRDEHRRLEEAPELNRPMATAYYMKEDLRQLWSQKDKSAFIKRAFKGFFDKFYRLLFTHIYSPARYNESMTSRLPNIVGFCSA
jgi:transposase